MNMIGPRNAVGADTSVNIDMEDEMDALYVEGTW